MITLLVLALKEWDTTLLPTIGMIDLAHFHDFVDLTETKNLFPNTSRHKALLSPSL